MENKKRILRVFIELLIAISIIIAFVIINEIITVKNNNSFKAIDDSNKFAYQVEKIGIEDDEIVIEGWFIELKKVRNQEREIKEEKELGIVLYDINSKTKVGKEDSQNKIGNSMRVERTLRPDINRYFQCEYDYSKCGFVARIKKTEIDLELGDYQVIFKPDCTEFDGICSQTYLSRGAIKYVNPNEEERLLTEGTDLDEIVTSGYCLLSSKEYGIWVYQYDRSLFWIANDEYFFEDDGGTHVSFLLETTQFDKLPPVRTENNLFWDSIGEEFEKNEITDIINCGEYRVSKRKIPNEYSITRIGTGYYVQENWVWQRWFRPVFLYE